MTESILYEYIKGRGWVPAPEYSEYYFSKNGRNFKIIDRLPEIGERGLWVYENGNKHTPVPRTAERLEAWANKVTNNRHWICAYDPIYPGCAVTIEFL